MSLDHETSLSGRFDPSRQAWSLVEPQRHNLTPDHLRVVTFNTWFGDHHTKARYTALLDILRHTDADIIGLQEVTPELLALILEQDWIRQNYLCSDVLGVTCGSYGVLLLSRWPVEAMAHVMLPSHMNRKLLLATYQFHREAFQVGVVHLESMASSAPQRLAQLAVINPIMTRTAHALLIGDYNFCARKDPERHHVDPSLRELWPMLHPNAPGFTEDTTRNIMRLRIKGREKHVRFDQMRLRTTSRGWTPREMTLLGTHPLAPELPEVWPSDHFGVQATIGWQAPAATK